MQGLCAVIARTEWNPIVKEFFSELMLPTLCSTFACNTSLTDYVFIKLKILGK